MKNGVHLQGFKGYFEGTKAMVMLNMICYVETDITSILY